MDIYSVVATHPVFSAVVFFLVYSVLNFILMEFSIDQSKDHADGMLHIKKKGWVINIFYKANCVRKEGYERYPKNLCGLYWGIWIYFPMTILFLSIASVVVMIAIAVFSIAWFVTNIIGCSLTIDADDKLKFLPYEYDENHNHIIAPWKILLPSILIGMAIIYPESISSSVATSTVDTTAWLYTIFISVISSKISWLSLGALVLIALCCSGIPKIMKWVKSSSTIAWIKAKKAKLCPLVVLEE